MLQTNSHADNQSPHSFDSINSHESGRTLQDSEYTPLDTLSSPESGKINYKLIIDHVSDNHIVPQTLQNPTFSSSQNTTTTYSPNRSTENQKNSLLLDTALALVNVYVNGATVTRKAIEIGLCDAYKLLDDSEKSSVGAVIAEKIKDARPRDALLNTLAQSALALAKSKPSLSESGLDNLPPKTWLIENFLGERDLGMVFGASGAGKSFVVLDMIGAMSVGSKFAGQFETTKKINVIYATGEGLAGLKSRYDAMKRRNEIGALPGIRFLEYAPQLFVDRDGNRQSDSVVDFIRTHKTEIEAGQSPKPDVIFIDTLHNATVGADENSSQAMGTVLHEVKKLSIEMDCAVVLVHHAGKNSDTYRGSSALMGAMDMMIKISKIDETGTKFVMKCEKMKDAAAWLPVTGDLVANGDSAAVWWDEKSDVALEYKSKIGDVKREILTILSDNTATRFTAKSITQALDVADSFVWKAIAALVKDGKVVRTLSYPTKTESSRNPWVYGLPKKGNPENEVKDSESENEDN